MMMCHASVGGLERVPGAQAYMVLGMRLRTDEERAIVMDVVSKHCQHDLAAPHALFSAVTVDALQRRSRGRFRVRAFG